MENSLNVLTINTRNPLASNENPQEISENCIGE